MVVHGGKPKIRHKNMADGIVENGGHHGGLAGTNTK